MPRGAGTQVALREQLPGAARDSRVQEHFPAHSHSRRGGPPPEAKHLRAATSVCLIPWTRRRDVRTRATQTPAKADSGSNTSEAPHDEPEAAVALPCNRTKGPPCAARPD
eukprot:CAMPEP_0168448182 /NCGR_PEP_ID=MMETSP0228-20121227/46964_1 /TAXON_ID=133427 /ORGANISM="Protoceratium reticulatum, Strain CCCM 535 (=CCMP 1889)" /LENGTH=109 /DNA_ID=CAMNT_0008462711 /DNA_START=8 /DNA_END=335 /DNA_ORIENTATION=+